MSAAEQQLYLQFLQHLGIPDDTKTGFLASLLRNVFDACTKLDTHLSPYGATVHSAVSRLVVPDNPRDAPSYRWIRVVDRIGFFSDDDAHAVRLVNVGLSYAYRVLEADAMAVANAALLDKNRTSTVPLAAAGAQAQIGRSGGNADPPPGPATSPRAEEAALPAGGIVVSKAAGQAADNSQAGAARPDGRGTLPAGGVVVNASAAGSRSPSAPGSPVNNGGPSSTPRVPPALAGSAGEARPADDSSVLSGSIGAQPSGAPAVPADGQDEEADEATDADDGAPTHIVYENQPSIVPTSTAVDTVASVLRMVGQRDDDTGKDVLRKLLIDSLLCLVRSEPGSKLVNGSDAVAGGSRKDWLAVGALTGRWWPRWKAPDVLGRMEAPKNTFAGVVHRGRVAKSSRWIVLVNMTGMKKSVEKLSVRSSRFFPKMQLPDEEPVLRVHYHKPLRLTHVVASMLLLATKEERFPAILTRLAADGRASVMGISNLASAGRHEFFSRSFRAAPAALPFSRPRVSGPAVDAGLAKRSSAQAAPPPLRLADKLVAMEAKLAAEGVKQSAINRRKRLEIMHARAAARSVNTARLPPRSSRPRSASLTEAASASAAGKTGDPPRSAMPNVLPSQPVPAAKREADVAGAGGGFAPRPSSGRGGAIIVRSLPAGAFVGGPETTPKKPSVAGEMSRGTKRPRDDDASQVMTPTPASSRAARTPDDSLLDKRVGAAQVGGHEATLCSSTCGGVAGGRGTNQASPGIASPLAVPRVISPQSADGPLTHYGPVVLTKPPPPLTTRETPPTSAAVPSDVQPVANDSGNEK